MPAGPARLSPLPTIIPAEIVPAEAPIASGRHSNVSNLSGLTLATGPNQPNRN